MENHESRKREASDEVDIARHPKRSSSDGGHSDVVDSKHCGGPTSGEDQAESTLTSPGDVLPNPGVSHDDEDYRMSNRERGVALIFSHKHFFGNYKTREGTEVDRDKLHDTFKSLGFEVHCFNDLTYQQITNELKLVARENHGSRDCVAVAVLSHGEKDGVLAARDRDYHVRELWEPFTARRCPTLAGKPKLFFIQACKGDIADPGVMVSNVITDAPDSYPVRRLSYPVPCYADILISYSTFEGNYAFLNNSNGSWYIQTLCSQLLQYAATRDIVSLLTSVNRLVGQHFRSQNKKQPELHGLVQAPCFTSSLTRRLCFG